MLISIILTIIVLVCAHIDYDTYNKGAVYLSWFLTPATVCLAIPLYEQWQLLKRNVKAVMLGITAGVLTSLTTVFVLSKLMGLTHQEYVTMLPKSITTAIGMGVSEELGGYVTITVAVIVVTGVIGNILGEFICKLFRITEPISRTCTWVFIPCNRYSQGNRDGRSGRRDEQSGNRCHRNPDRCTRIRLRKFHVRKGKGYN